MPTLWQMFVNWWKVPEKIYNPLNLNPGSTVKVDNLDFRKYIFIVETVSPFHLDKGVFTDYTCRTTLEDEAFNIKIRVYPHEIPGRELQLLILKQWDQLDYDEDFKALLNQQFDVSVDDVLEASFWRINDLTTPYETKEGMVFWDYWRETKDEGGTTYKEFLFVEWDKSDTGRFTIWRGEEIPPSIVQ